MRASSLNSFAILLNTAEMGSSLTVRRMLRRRPRRLTTFVSLLWLNLAMLPCTMAAGVADQGPVPDCPSKAKTAHHEHLSGLGGAADLQHPAPAAAHAIHGADSDGHPCTSDDDCCALDDVITSDGAKKLDRDAGTLPPVAWESACFDPLIGSKSERLATGPPGSLAVTVRLHALHCVYRD